MVDGHALKKLVAVDLDGTLIHGNSLRLYLWCALRDCVRRRHPLTAARICAVLALRVARIYSHRRMKWRLLQLGGASTSLKNDFTARIKAMMRDDVTQILRTKSDSGCRIVLATAAPDLYIPWFWEGDYLASATFDNPGHIECRGSNKLKAVTAYAAKNGMTLDTVLTDHIDDLALLTADVAHRILVNPSARTLAAVNMAGIPIDTILR